ncbi:MAG: hypothetical protein IPL53_09635 [Ignavibacteria bacterium]|nr:hypothetical protein [Ignavibacteria bacterium]
MRSESLSGFADINIHQRQHTKRFKILEIGGGDSRILKHFSKDFECWNLDKMEGLGNGPVAIHRMISE